jgi:ATP-binding cassette subfamily F protein uup
VRRGANVLVAYYDQQREQLDPERTVFDTVGDGNETVTVNGQPRHVHAYLRDFLFPAERARSPVKALSGGERNRLLLARLFTRPANVLVLDEPTNDLDLETLDVLEEMLGDYAGTILLISHDRDFLDRVVNAVIVPEGSGRWAEYAGGYTDMLAQRGEDVAREAVGKPARPREAKAPSPSEPRTARRRLSFNEKYALETLPGEIAALQHTIRSAQQKLADPGLYARDRKAFDEISAALVAAQGELSTAEDKWLELEILRETIDGA